MCVCARAAPQWGTLAQIRALWAGRRREAALALAAAGAATVPAAGGGRKGVAVATASVGPCRKRTGDLYRRSSAAATYGGGNLCTRWSGVAREAAAPCAGRATDPISISASDTADDHGLTDSAPAAAAAPPPPCCQRRGANAAARDAASTAFVWAWPSGDGRAKRAKRASAARAVPALRISPGRWFTWYVWATANPPTPTHRPSPCCSARALAARRTSNPCGYARACWPPAPVAS